MNNGNIRGRVYSKIFSTRQKTQIFHLQPIVNLPQMHR